MVSTLPRDLRALYLIDCSWEPAMASAMRFASRGCLVPPGLAMFLVGMQSDLDKLRGLHRGTDPEASSGHGQSNSNEPQGTRSKWMWGGKRVFDCAYDEYAMDIVTVLRGLVAALSGSLPSSVDFVVLTAEHSNTASAVRSQVAFCLGPPRKVVVPSIGEKAGPITDLSLNFLSWLDLVAKGQLRAMWRKVLDIIARSEPKFLHREDRPMPILKTLSAPTADDVSDSSAGRKRPADKIADGSPDRAQTVPPALSLNGREKAAWIFSAEEFREAFSLTEFGPCFIHIINMLLASSALAAWYPQSSQGNSVDTTSTIGRLYRVDFETSARLQAMVQTQENSKSVILGSDRTHRQALEAYVLQIKPSSALPTYDTSAVPVEEALAVGSTVVPLVKKGDMPSKRRRAQNDVDSPPSYQTVNSCEDVFTDMRNSSVALFRSTTDVFDMSFGTATCYATIAEAEESVARLALVFLTKYAEAARMGSVSHLPGESSISEEERVAGTSNNTSSSLGPTAAAPVHVQRSLINSTIISYSQPLVTWAIQNGLVPEFSFETNNIGFKGTLLLRKNEAQNAETQVPQKISRQDVVNRSYTGKMFHKKKVVAKEEVAKLAAEDLGIVQKIAPRSTKEHGAPAPHLGAKPIMQKTPMALINEYCQRQKVTMTFSFHQAARSGDLNAEPVAAKDALHGASLSIGDEVFMTAAKFSNKSEAKTAVATMACHRLGLLSLMPGPNSSDHQSSSSSRSKSLPNSPDKKNQNPAHSNRASFPPPRNQNVPHHQKRKSEPDAGPARSRPIIPLPPPPHLK